MNDFDDFEDDNEGCVFALASITSVALPQLLLSTVPGRSPIELPSITRLLI